MNRLRDAIIKDLWVVLLDAISVNAAYFLALLIRFYVNFQLRPIAVSHYLPAWIGFTPWYTVICIAVFAAFRLYGGIWRYAGVHDMNRIILANAVTSVIHIAATALFFRRMPITYYLIGTFLQFAAVVLIRFAYRILLVERKRIDTWRGKRIDAIVFGTGENGRRVVKSLEESEVYRPVAVVGPGEGMMDGLPIISGGKLPKAGAMFIADSLLSNEERKRLKAQAEKEGMEYHEYTGFFSNIGGKLSLTDLLATIHTPVILSINGAEQQYPDGEAALQSLTEKYAVTEVSGEKLRLILNSSKKPTAKESLEQAYAAVRDEE